MRWNLGQNLKAVSFYRIKEEKRWNRWKEIKAVLEVPEKNKLLCQVNKIFLELEPRDKTFRAKEYINFLLFHPLSTYSEYHICNNHQSN